MDKKYEHTITEQWYDWDSYKEQTGFDYDSYVLLEQCGSKRTMYPNDIKDPCEDATEDERDAWYNEVERKSIEIDLREVPKKSVDVRVIYRDEIGYQRKGLNHKFYQDYDDGKIGYFVWSKDELGRYKRDYCDEDHVSEYDRHYFCTPKQDFQESIIDTFVEGECCVCFDW
jgi:hypothetical protein